MIYLIVLLSLFLSFEANAATLYVNNSGTPTCSNSTVKASNSAASPWCDVYRAAWGSTTYASPNTGEAAAAGDVVLITAGTYTTLDGATDAGGRFNVILQPANSGTLGNPITFRGVGTVELRVDQPTSIRGPHIGANGRNYIVWDHVVIDDYYQASVGDTGPVVFNAQTGGQLLNSTIRGHNGSFLSGVTLFTNNYSLVRMEYSSGITIKNNSISRAWGLGTTAYSGSENDACIMTYGTDEVVIEHNEFDDCGAGVFIKGMSSSNNTQDNIIIRYNRISDSEYGIRLALNSDVHIYQNIVTGTSGRTEWALQTGINTGENFDGTGSPTRPTVASISGSTVTLAATYANSRTGRLFRMVTDGVLYEIASHTGGSDTITLTSTYLEATTSGNAWIGFPDSLRARVVNNTVYGANNCLVPFGDDIVASEVHYKNNICVNATNAVENQPASNPNLDAVTFDWNWYYGSTRHAQYGGGTNYNFATWQGTYSRDTNSTNGTDPQFVDAAGGNFHLTGGSPALTAGRVVESIGGTNGDTIPAGAYITGNETIGIESTVGSVGVSGTVGFSGTVRLQ